MTFHSVLSAALQPFVSPVKQNEADIQVQEATCLSSQMQGLLERKSSDMAQA